jgi:hypothetical protein
MSNIEIINAINTVRNAYETIRNDNPELNNTVQFGFEYRIGFNTILDLIQKEYTTISSIVTPEIVTDHYRKGLITKKHAKKLMVAWMEQKKKNLFVDNSPR